MFDDVNTIEKARADGFIRVVGDKPYLKEWLLKKQDGSARLDESSIELVLSASDKFSVGIGRAVGSDRAKLATQKAISFIMPKIEPNIIIFITSANVSIDEIDRILDIISEFFDCERGHIFYMLSNKEDLLGEMEVGVIVAEN